MATHSSILSWEIPWTEELGWLQSMGLPRVGHDLVTERTRARARAHTHTHVLLVGSHHVNRPFKSMLWTGAKRGL